MKLALLLSLAVGASAQFGDVIKANADQTETFQVCGAQGTAPGAGLFLGPCKNTGANAFDTYGYMSIAPKAIGTMNSRSAKEYNGDNYADKDGIDFKNANGGFSKGKVNTDGEVHFAYVTAGGFLGDVTGLKDAGTGSAGGFIGSSMYIITKGTTSPVDSNLFRLGEKDDGKVHYADIPLPKTQSYKAGDLKFNIYSWMNPETPLKDYFGVRYKIQYFKGATDELEEPQFYVGGEWVTVNNGQSLDNVEKIQFTTKQCKADKKYCFILDTSAVDVRYGVGPTDCAEIDPSESDSKLIPASEIARSKIKPKNCFGNAGEFANKKLQVNIRRVTTTEFEVDFTFVTAEFQGFTRRGVNYLIFDPKGALTGAEASSGVVATISAAAVVLATAFLY